MKSVAIAIRTLALIPLLVSCGSAVDISCTSDEHGAIWVRPVDSVSGDSLAVARLIIREGAYADTAASPYLGSLVAGRERPGTYEVFVSATGYKTWFRSGVVATGDRCHVHEVKLTARLLLN